MPAAAVFSSRCAIEDVPGIGSTTGDLRSSHASASWAGVASCSLAAASSTPPGWHADGYAITDVSAMYHVFEFEGPDLADMIAEAMFVDPRAKSPSAATVFAGQQAIVYHRDGRLRVHVERGFAPYVWQWLEARD